MPTLTLSQLLDDRRTDMTPADELLRQERFGEALAAYSAETGDNSVALAEKKAWCHTMQADWIRAREVLAGHEAALTTDGYTILAHCLAGGPGKEYALHDQAAVQKLLDSALTASEKPSPRAFSAYLHYEYATEQRQLEVARAAVGIHPGVLTLWELYAQRSHLPQDDRLRIIDGLRAGPPLWQDLPRVQWLLANQARAADRPNLATLQLTHLETFLDAEDLSKSPQAAVIFTALGEAWLATAAPDQARKAFSRAQEAIGDALDPRDGATAELAEPTKTPFEMRVRGSQMALEIEHGDDTSVKNAAHGLAGTWLRATRPVAALFYLKEAPPALPLGEGVDLKLPKMDHKLLDGAARVLDLLSGDASRHSRGALRFVLADMAYDQAKDTAVFLEQATLAHQECERPVICARMAGAVLNGPTPDWRKAGELWGTYAAAVYQREYIEPVAFSATISDADLAEYVTGLRSALTNDLGEARLRELLDTGAPIYHAKARGMDDVTAMLEAGWARPRETVAVTVSAAATPERMSH